MSRFGASARGFLLLSALLLGTAFIAGAQQEGGDPEPESGTDAPGLFADGADGADSADDDAQSFDEDAASNGQAAPGGYSYDSGGRRDPFRSLLSVRRRPEATGPRPDGIPGLLIDEIDVTGIFVTADGSVAQIRSTQQEQSYLLHEGDQLYDGDVVSISGDEVVFKQIVDDPTAIKPFHEVVKKLNP